MDEDQKKIAAAFRQMADAAQEIAEILGRRDDLNESVPKDFPIHMSVDEFAFECLGMVSHYRTEANRLSPTESHIETVMKGLGFEIEHTGGGCMAWAKFDRNETGRWSVLVTCDDDLYGSLTEKEWLVGFYGEDNAFIAFDQTRTFNEAIELACWLMNPEGAGLDARSELWERVMRNTDIEDYRIE